MNGHLHLTSRSGFAGRFGLAASLMVASLSAGCMDRDRVPSPVGATDPEPDMMTPFDPFPPTSGGGGAFATLPPPETGSAGSTGSATVCGPAGTPVTPAMRLPPLFRPELPTVVARAAPPPRAITGGTLLVLRDGSAAVVSDADRDRLYVVDLKTRALRAQLPLTDGDEPGRLVEDGKGLVHVALRRGGAVVTVNPVTGTLGARQAVCAAPRGLAYSASLDRVQVACAEGKVVSLPAAGGAAVRTVDVGTDLRDVVDVGQGRLLVSSFRSAKTYLLDANGKPGLATAPPVRQRKGATGIQSLSAAVAWRMIPAVDGASAVMLHQRGVDDAVDPAAGGYSGGKGCDGIVEPVISVVTPGTSMPVAPGIAMVTLAVDVALSPDGKSMALAVPGAYLVPSAQQVVTFPTGGLSNAGQDCQFGGSAPTLDPAVTPTVITGQVVAVSYLATGAVVAQTRSPAGLWFSDGSQALTLSNDDTADTGHTLFHVNAGGGIACASCHPEGGEDGRVWNFACLGPRRTQSLRGRLSGTEPFHWDGDMKTFPQLVDEVFVGRMSGPPLSTEQSSALLGWLDSVPELPTVTPTAATAVAAVTRGKALFGDATVGCASCHAGATFTNSTTVDVGTGRALQVPSLRGVAWRAPFLHNGCAPTLTDRFGTCGGGDQHGKTSQLLPTQVADLTAYLGTL
jgi:mono/diheme cytochrome c family protein